MNEKWRSEIERLSKENTVLVCMRGTPDHPRCGFSARVVNIFKKLEQPFAFLDMDSDPELWQTLRELNQWRTSPQIFIKGEFIGGCDILTEMYQDGSLSQMLKNASASSSHES